jgi:hypothetical protein
MATITPREPTHGELEALIEEARGWARRRRLMAGAAVLKTVRRPLRNSNPFDQSQVTWRVPKNVRVSAPLEIR